MARRGGKIIHHETGAICLPLPWEEEAYGKPCFLVRLLYTKTFAIGLTERFKRLFAPRVENMLNTYGKGCAEGR